MAYELKDYVEVADRIQAWYAEHPGGRIETNLIEFTDVRVVIRAEVYRSDEADEPPAGTGYSFLAIPGSTPYTRGSELENAETSAVGRALVMAGIPSKNVASAGEVRSKKSDGSTAALEGHPLPAAQHRDPATAGISERGPSEVGAEGSTGDGGHGEGTEASEGTSAPTYIDGATIEALIKAFPSKAAATKEAHKRFGVLSLAYLTQTQADELYDAEVTL